MARVSLVAAALSLTTAIGALAGAAAAEQPPDKARPVPRVRLAITVAEFAEADRAAIEKKLGVSTTRSFGKALSAESVESLKDQKLLRVTTAPTIVTSSGNRAFVSYVADIGRDQDGKSVPGTHEIEVVPQFDPDSDKMVVVEVRYRETAGSGRRRRTREIDTGARFESGQLRFLGSLPLGPNANKEGDGAGCRLILLKATIETPQVARRTTYPNPR